MSVTIRDFAAIVAPMQPAELAVFLRQLHDRLAGIILDRNGMLDTQSGDGLLALFNAPLDDASHADHAAEAAAKIGAGFDALNAARRAAAEAAGRKYRPRPSSTSASTPVTAPPATSPRNGTPPGRRSARASASRRGSERSARSTGSASSSASAPSPACPTRRCSNSISSGSPAAASRSASSPSSIRWSPTRASRPRLAAAHARMIAAYRNADWTEAETALRECRSFRIEPLATLYSLYRTRIVTATRDRAAVGLGRRRYGNTRGDDSL